MNPYTNEIVKSLQDVPEALREKFVSLPGELQEDAEEVLGGQERAVANVTIAAGRRLLEFAKRERAKRDKAKMESKKKRKASRRARRRSR